MPTLTVLSSFPTTGGRPSLVTTPVIDSAGDLIATRTTSSTSDGTLTGTVFELAAATGGLPGAPITLATVPGTLGALVADRTGNLYGTASVGGAGGGGMVFELPRTATGFGPMVTLASLSAGEYGSLAFDAAGNLFGATRGNLTTTFGRVFELAKTAGGYASTPTTLASFSSSLSWLGGLAVNAGGDVIYDVAAPSGLADRVVALSPLASGGYASAPTTVFSADINVNGRLGSLVLDASGDVFVKGSNYSSEQLTYVARTGASSYAPGVLIDYEQANYGVASAQDTLLLDANGDVFFPTVNGGTLFNSSSPGTGAIVRVDRTAAGYAAVQSNPARSDTSGSHAIYTFDRASNGSNVQPLSGLTADAAGNLYGVTLFGGANNAGYVYKLSDAGYRTAALGNTAPAIGGAAANQATTDKATLAPFATVTITDPDAGQTETVTLAYAAANGALSGAGFSGSAGSYTGTFASAAAAQAALRAVVFRPTANQAAPGTSVSTGFTITVSDGTASATDAATSVVAASVNDAPTITGAVRSLENTSGRPLPPFPLIVLTDPDVGQTESVVVTFTGANGRLTGGGFTGADGRYTFSGSVADAQAALRAVVFTPLVEAVTTLTVSVSDGLATVADSTTQIYSVAPRGANTPPTISGTTQTTGAIGGMPVSPFAGVVLTDPDAGQVETVTVSFSAGGGVLSGGGFTGGGGVYTFSGTVAQAQAALRTASFTPTPGLLTTLPVTLTVNDGFAETSDSSTSISVVAPGGGGGGGGSGAGGGRTALPLSAQAGLSIEMQNLVRALAMGSDAQTPASPIAAQMEAGRKIAALYDAGSLGLAQAESALAHVVDGTTAVAVASYGFFTGRTPTLEGLNYLVHSSINATDLNDAYYAKFSVENRFINFAVNMGSGVGAGAAGFQAAYGGLSLAEATAKAYLAVFGTAADPAKVSALLDTPVPDGLGGTETRAQYLAQYGGDGPSGLGTKAALVGFLLAQAVHDGSGVYGTATEHYLSALAHGAAPRFDTELALTYGRDPALVGVTPTLDPTLAG